MEKRPILLTLAFDSQPIPMPKEYGQSVKFVESLDKTPKRQLQKCNQHAPKETQLQTGTTARSVDAAPEVVVIVVIDTDTRISTPTTIPSLLGGASFKVFDGGKLA